MGWPTDGSKEGKEAGVREERWYECMTARLEDGLFASFAVFSYRTFNIERSRLNGAGTCNNIIGDLYISTDNYLR